MMLVCRCWYEVYFGSVVESCGFLTSVCRVGISGIRVLKAFPKMFSEAAIFDAILLLMWHHFRPNIYDRGITASSCSCELHLVLRCTCEAQRLFFETSGAVLSHMLEGCKL